jgi:hypothetical protein
LFVLQVSGNGPDDRLSRAAGIHFVAFFGGADAHRGGLVVMTDDCEHRAAQPWVGARAGDLADWRAGLHQGRHQLRRSSGPGQALAPPATTRQVEPAGAAGESQLGYLITAQTAYHPFGDVEPANRIRR